VRFAQTGVAFGAVAAKARAKAEGVALIATVGR